MPKLRIEVPVLLYMNVEVPDGDAASMKRAAMGKVFDVIGQPGAEDGASIQIWNCKGFSDEWLYTSNHEWCDSAARFSVVEERETECSN